MEIFNQLDKWRAFRRTLPPKTSIGFVPTMGNLHKGHASLYAISRAENDLSVASIFINPTQFNDKDDFVHYPRTLDADLDILKAQGVDYCILPDEKLMYQDGYRYKVTESSLCQLMEGAHRPGHFDGVLTVVMKLLQLVQPTTAYFGEKDYQQYQLIKDMVSAFFMDIHIKSCPTIREPSGLAYSSRNNRLTTSQKNLADRFAKLFHQKKTSEVLAQEIQDQGITVEYIKEYQGRRFAAVHIGEVRLIDNYYLGE